MTYAFYCEDMKSQPNNKFPNVSQVSLWLKDSVVIDIVEK
jgi:hypothetical protein